MCSKEPTCPPSYHHTGNVATLKRAYDVLWHIVVVLEPSAQIATRAISEK